MRVVNIFVTRTGPGLLLCGDRRAVWRPSTHTYYMQCTAPKMADDDYETPPEE